MHQFSRNLRIVSNLNRIIILGNVSFEYCLQEVALAASAMISLLDRERQTDSNDEYSLLSPRCCSSPRNHQITILCITFYYIRVILLVYGIKVLNIP